MTEHQKKALLEEAKKTRLPSSFAGGCKKSSIEGFCVHLRPNGTVGKIEEGCPYLGICNGKNFKYNV